MTDVEVILHIGLEKTGTKTLQAFLSANRGRLADQSILFPQSPGRRNHRLLALLGYAVADRDDITATAKVDSAGDLMRVRTSLLGGLQQELSSTPCRRLLLASEHFQSRLRTPESIAGFREALAQLGCRRFSVLVYLRDPVEIARSLHASSVATGGLAAGPPPPDNSYFHNICDHRSTLQRWGEVFGRDAIVPRLFCRSELVGGSIIDDFCQVAGIELDPSWPRPRDRNQSISALGLRLLRRLNRIFPRIQNNRINPERGELSEYVRRNYPGPPCTLAPELADAYRDYFSESNEWVREHYFPGKSVLFPEKGDGVPQQPERSEAYLDAEAARIEELWRKRQGLVTPGR